MSPANPGSFNRYAFLGGDPINRNDPSGLDTINNGNCVDPNGNVGWTQSIDWNMTTICIADTDPADNTTINPSGFLTVPDQTYYFTDTVTLPPSDPEPSNTQPPLDIPLFVTSVIGGGGTSTNPATGGSQVPRGGSRGLPRPVSIPNKVLPTTIPGTQYCGPGGNGTPTNQVDAACASHDLCYENAGATWRNNLPLYPTTPEQQAAIQGCDVSLCNTLSNIYLPTSAENGQATLVSTWFGCNGGYSLRP